MPALLGRVAVAGHGDQAVDEVGRRRPAAAAGPSAGGWASAGASSKRLCEARRCAQRRERRVHRRRAEAVEPGAPVLVARRGEGGAGQLLGIEAEAAPAAASSGRAAGRPGRPRSRTGCRSRTGSRCLTIIAMANCVLTVITPRRIWSSSIDSNSAWKLPLPKPSLPLRWMISKKIGPNMFSVKICSSMPSSVSDIAVDQDAVLAQPRQVLAVVRARACRPARNRSRSCPGTRRRAARSCSTVS